MKILLADDSPDVRTALRLVLEHQNGCEICGEAADAIQLLALCVQTCPDAIILDAELSGLPAHRRPASLRELAQTLRRLCPSACLVALSSFHISEKDPWLRFVDASFSKSDPPDELLAFLRDHV